MPGADEIRDAQRHTWAGLSAGWEKWDSIITDQLGPVGAAMIGRLDIHDAQHHLDVAVGTGEPGLSIARLAPEGRVVLTDLVPEMLEIAARRAAAQGITNIDTRVCSADDLPYGDARFDSVSVRFGYMFFPDPGQATAELARVLRPGGRLCSSVWVKPDENPWTTIAMQAIATETSMAPPDPDGPNMFRCAAPGYVGALYEDADLHDVAEWEVRVELVTRSPVEYWDMISEHVSLAVAALQQVDEPARERIRANVIATVRAFERDGQVRVPGLARCIVGTRSGSDRCRAARRPDRAVDGCWRGPCEEGADLAHCSNRGLSIAGARDHVEGRAAGFDVRVQELRDVFGRPVRRVPLERLERHLVEGLHLGGERRSGRLTPGGEATPDVERMLELARVSAGPGGLLIYLVAHGGESPGRHPYPEPSVAQPGGPAGGRVRTAPNDKRYPR
jgi:SAM-dependent methyltransferase